MNDTEKTLMALEEELWRANREGDADFYRHLLTDDALLVSRYSGVASKAVVVPMIEANQNPFLRTTLSEQRVRILSPTAALISYRADYTALINGSEVDLAALATTVYIWDNDQWRVTLHQQTAL